MLISNMFNLQIVPEKWTMHQVPADLTIHQEQAKMQLDYKANRASIGYQEPLDFQVSFSNEALDTVKQGIERRVQEGEMLKAEKHVAFSDIARQKEGKPMGNPTLMYIQPVQVHIQRVIPHASVQLGGVYIQYTPGTVHVETKSTVDVRA